MCGLCACAFRSPILAGASHAHTHSPNWLLPLFAIVCLLPSCAWQSMCSVCMCNCACRRTTAAAIAILCCFFPGNFFFFSLFYFHSADAAIFCVFALPHQHRHVLESRTIRVGACMRSMKRTRSSSACEAQAESAATTTKTVTVNN